MLSWVSVLAVTVIVGLVVSVAVWLVRGHLRARRHAKFLAQLAEQYRQTRRTLPAARGLSTPRGELPRRVVTVDELIARIEGEGLPVRLQWDENEDRSERW